MVFDLTAFLQKNYVTSEREMVTLVDLMNHVRSQLSEKENHLWTKRRLANELQLRGVPVGRAIRRMCVGLERRDPRETCKQSAQNQDTKEQSTI